jgi:hypothetical protein
LPFTFLLFTFFFGRIFAGMCCGMMPFAWKRNGNHAPRIQEKVGFEGSPSGAAQRQFEK